MRRSRSNQIHFYKDSLWFLTVMTFNMALSVSVRCSIYLALTLSDTDTICIWMCQWKVWGGLSWKSITSELNTSNWHQIYPATVGQHPPSTIRRLHFRSKPGNVRTPFCKLYRPIMTEVFLDSCISQSCGKQGAILCHCSFSFRAWGAITWPIKPHLVQIAILKSDSSTACTTQIIALLAKNTTRVLYQTTGPQALATS